uniref:NADH-ubiquinone oxidoreductase chain 6 n=1 Tax=Phloeosinus perlatus TaxID=2800998 RepID=A0A891GPY5_9CUCU|nr:NADH dehydrogenase subunit 6 [Phloeosinus perlatus]QRK25839.1 NADH dehydrogenase subunit 6 [Phloeosinus perlatus]
MLAFFMVMSLSLSVTFVFLKHPLSLGYTLLLQTIMIASFLSNFFPNSWFSYILFLIMVSGMLVMYIYMTSIASNEKFKIPKKLTVLLLVISFLTMTILMLDKFWYMPMSSSYSMNSNMFYFSMSKFFNHPNMQLILMLMIYLLITLIAVVKINMKPMGSLRQK